MNSSRARILRQSGRFLFGVAISTALCRDHSPRAAILTGQVIDDTNQRPIASRVYLQNAAGQSFFPASLSEEGSAVRYEKRNWVNTNAVENHTTLSAHPFQVELEPGRYTLTVERGKEYRPLVERIDVASDPVRLTLPLHRWINMAARGWYSGDTHVHRSLVELSNVMQAEDLNVAFPLSYWVTKAFTAPTAGDKNSAAVAAGQLLAVDATHVIYPRNTEYEIFTVNGKSHTLGAVFVLNHQTPLRIGAPPLTAVAGHAKLEGALLDLDKHNWPWSMALVPIMDIDLYELANNHMWRTEFGLTNWSVPAPPYMKLPQGGRPGGELEWIEYTFENYYALLDCGFHLRPSAGTANGVHPVPLGFGRVYVQLPGGFTYNAWLKRFNEGRSFVTTGPMLFAEIDGQLPGFHFQAKPAKSRHIRVEGTVCSEQPISAIEIIQNGEIVRRLTPLSGKNREGAFEAKFSQATDLTGSGWLAVRCWENREAGRVRFAHTAPSYFTVPGEPLRPRKEEIGFLIDRVQEEIARSAEVLPAAALGEYQEALKAFKAIGRTAR